MVIIQRMYVPGLNKMETLAREKKNESKQSTLKNKNDKWERKQEQERKHAEKGKGRNGEKLGILTFINEIQK